MIMEMVAQNHERHAKFVYFIFRANEHATSFCNNKHSIGLCTAVAMIDIVIVHILWKILMTFLLIILK